MKKVNYLGWIDDTSIHHVNKDSVECVVSQVWVVSFHDLVHDDGGIDSGVLCNLHHGLLEGMSNNFNTLTLVLVNSGNTVQDAEAPTGETKCVQMRTLTKKIKSKEKVPQKN